MYATWPTRETRVPRPALGKEPRERSPASAGGSQGRRGQRVIDLRSKIREVPDFPTPGVGFKDITPLLADRDALQETIAGLAEWSIQRNPDMILGAEARGFILGAAIASQVGCGFVPA